MFVFSTTDQHTRQGLWSIQPLFRHAGPIVEPAERLLAFEGLADGGAGYADVIVNPTHWPAWHGRLPAMIDAIHAGLSAAEQDGLPPVGLCISLRRTVHAGESSGPEGMRAIEDPALVAPLLCEVAVTALVAVVVAGFPGVFLCGMARMMEAGRVALGQAPGSRRRVRWACAGVGGSVLARRAVAEP